MILRNIPSTGETLPIIGLGTWSTFDVTRPADHPPLEQVLQAVVQTAKGALIDSSPMYGRAEEVVGNLTQSCKLNEDFFYATKVWTTGKQEGIQQMESSLKKMRRQEMDLMQIHNLTDWKTHLTTLRDWKEQGKIRYLGVTHYTDSMHPELEKVIMTEKIDFVQFNYSITSRNAEKRLLPAAADKGVATLINRPLGEGTLFTMVRGKALPEWAKDYDIHSWTQFFLKFIASHPAVTCIIPATRKPTHAADNMQAGQGRLPDQTIREKMVTFIESL
ncbi:aldo/keto reductase [Cytophagaceae bacterium DM2B3-1]|uniref:Aldo/keto reductase n=1 Tax=Xanthocytophaga flava TaxID=3048013 RepID=A0ABT7CNW9_9BACT|nr:aldo/keto reductase [Xanthocytophaga flavus]MDJ1495436.1 aldo/keto reductase [Xanthocytophaga flavus]